MLDPRDLLHKIDYEGSEGVTWFRPDEFEDPYIQEKLVEAIKAYSALENAITELERYITSGLGEEEEEE